MTTTSTLTLTDFLLARIAEDEAAAHYATTRDPVDDRAHGGWGGWWIGHYHHYTRHSPTRVLAECRAKRRIIQRHEAASAAAEDRFHVGAVSAFGLALRALALPYADHPAYRDEWRP